MDQKITARTALTTGVDPVNDILPVTDISAGASGSKKITINNLFAGWGMTPAGAAMAKATDLQAQKAFLGVGNFEFHPEINQPIGGLPNCLDSVPTVNLPLGTRILYGGADGYLMIYKLGVAFDASDSIPYYIAPDDYNPSTNAKNWQQESMSVNTFRCNSLQVFDGQHIVAFSPNGSATQDRYIVAPDLDGVISIERAVVVLAGVIPTSTIVGRLIDVLYYLNAVGPLASHTLVLPSDNESRDGQSVIFKSRAAITAFTVAATGTALDATMPTTITAGQTVEFMYCKLATIWLRIK